MGDHQKIDGSAKTAEAVELSMGNQLCPGVTLPGGWKVTAKCGPEMCGRFSSGYLVVNEKDNRPGFLKALNYESYLLSDDPTEVLKAALDAYHDEARLLGLARAKKLDRIVTLYDGQTLRGQNGLAAASYLIFELAESDGRQQLDVSNRAEYFSSISMLHDVAVGIHQLHRQQIAHQDLRAANVLCYSTARAKIADLGKAVDPKAIAQHIEDAVAGDETYAPPELLYNSVSPDWAIRRFGCDLYLLGSLMVTFFIGTGMTPQLLSELPSALHPQNWQGESYREVLPYLTDASARTFQRLQAQLVRESGDERWAVEITTIVRQLCNPDPDHRGDAENARRGQSRFNLERYVAKLDRLAKTAQTFRKKTA